MSSPARRASTMPLTVEALPFLRLGACCGSSSRSGFLAPSPVMNAS